MGVVTAHRMYGKVVRTGKTPCYFLGDAKDWTPVPMDEEFWSIVVGGLQGLEAV